MKKNSSEYLVGFILLAIVLLLGITQLGTPLLLSRLIIGLGIGYVLVRASYGFAGTANRSFNSGSTKLMRSFMFLVILASFVTVFFAAVPASDVNPEFAVKYGHFIHPITIGTFLGALVFGIGMSFAGGCASGVLTDLSSAFPKALLALIFFGTGRFLGAPLEKSMNDFINKSFVTSSDKVKGVWFPDLFKFDGLNGFLGALILTIVLALIVTKIAYAYEEKRRRERTYTPVESEEASEAALVKVQTVESTWYERIFARPWTLTEGAIGMAIMYAAMMGFTKAAWGVSGAFGFWIGKLASIFMGADGVAKFTGNEKYIAEGIFKHQQSVQDIGIILGGFIALLTMGKLFNTFKSGLKISGSQAVLAIVGGLLMGFGTIFAKGCNAGGLFSPIVSFSLSGWIYLVFMVAGSFIGNRILKGQSK